MPQGQFGLNGLALTDDQTLYVVSLAGGKLFRVAIGAAGEAGAVTDVATSAPLAGPDGLEVMPDGRLLTVEGGGLSTLRIAGDAATVERVVTRLDQPTTHAISGQDVWVAEGQFSFLFTPDSGTPNLPFRAVRLPLPR